MTRPRKPEPDDPKQSARFVEAAKRAEVSEDPKVLDGALSKVVGAAKKATP